MDELGTAVRAELPVGWMIEIDRSGDGVSVRCEHVVFGDYHLEWPPGFESRAPQPERLVVDRLVDAGLVDASSTMPDLSENDVETLRRAFAFISAGRLSKVQAYESISFAQSLTDLSRRGWEWAREAIDLLAPLYEYPAHPDWDEEHREGPN